MGQVIEIKPGIRNPDAIVHTADQHGAKYVCSRCDAFEFKIHADGLIFCGDCGARINNLTVNPLGDKHVA